MSIGNANINSYSDTNGNADIDCDSHRDAYPKAGPDHTPRAWPQSARSTNGGPLMGWGDFKQHRRLPSLAARVFALVGFGFRALTSSGCPAPQND